MLAMKQNFDIFFSILAGWLSNYNQYKILNKTPHSGPANDDIELV